MGTLRGVCKEISQGGKGFPVQGPVQYTGGREGGGVRLNDQLCHVELLQRERDGEESLRE